MVLQSKNPVRRMRNKARNWKKIFANLIPEKVNLFSNGVPEPLTKSSPLVTFYITVLHYQNEETDISKTL